MNAIFSCAARSCLTAVVLLVVVGVSGCKRAVTATVTGKVVYARQPLTQGTVSVYTEKGEVRSCLIASDGAYRITDLSTGPANVVVVSHPTVPIALHEPGPFPAPGPATPPGTVPAADFVRRGIVIPLRYTQPESSGLSLLLQRGEQNFDIELTP